jgi:hypothetical protein
MHVFLEQKWQKPKSCSECKNKRKTYTRKNKTKISGSISHRITDEFWEDEMYV